MAYLLTTHQFRVLADVVVDPQDWADNGFAVLGAAFPLALATKVEKYERAYDASKARLGAAYKTRADRAFAKTKPGPDRDALEAAVARVNAIL